MDLSYYVNELQKTEGELSELYSETRKLLDKISSIRSHIEMIKEQIDAE